jgi:hypothetical protein
MEFTARAWDAARLAGDTLLPFVVIRTPMGDRAYGIVHPAVGDALSQGHFEADSYFDADQFFQADGGVIEEGARLIGVSQIEQSAQAKDSNVLGSWGQAERAHAQVTLDASADAIRDLVGQEYLLNQVAEVYLTFPGLAPADALRVLSGQVRSWTLGKRRLALEIEVL